MLHGQLVGTVSAPLSGLVRTLNALVAGLAVQLQQIADQGLAGAEQQEPEGAAEPEAEQTTESEPEQTPSEAESDAKEE